MPPSSMGSNLLPFPGATQTYLSEYIKSILKYTFLQCVVVENIHTSPWRKLEIQGVWWVRGSKTQEILEDRGLDRQFSFQISFNCVPPDNILPPLPMEWIENSREWEVTGGGMGGCLNEFSFFPYWFQFSYCCA